LKKNKKNDIIFASSSYVSLSKRRLAKLSAEVGVSSFINLSD